MLSKLQLKTIEYLLRSANQNAACYNAGIDRKTLDKWMQNPEFKETLKRAAAEVKARKR